MHSNSALFILFRREDEHHFSHQRADGKDRIYSNRARVGDSLHPCLLQTMLHVAARSALRAARTQLPRPSTSPLTQSNRLAHLLSTLAILEHRDGKLNTASLGAVTAGRQLGGPVTGLIAGKGVKAVADEISKVEGLEKVLVVDNDAYERGLPENFAPMLAENVKKGGYTHVIVGHSAFGKNLLPRVAALLDVQQISDIMKIESEDSKCLLPTRPTSVLKRIAQPSFGPSMPATPSLPSNPAIRLNFSPSARRPSHPQSSPIPPLPR